MSDSDLIGLNISLLCKTTGWHNNCGLNCLTHFLYSKIENNELPKFFANNTEYKALLATFQEYYALPFQPTWDDLKKILGDLEAPSDREAVLSPVLRKHLGKIIARKPSDIWPEGSAALSEYLNSGEMNDIAVPIIKANQVFFDALKKQYDDHLQHALDKPITNDEITHAIDVIKVNNSGLNAKEVLLTDDNINKQIEFTRKSKIETDLQSEAKYQWVNKGVCQNYANFISDMNNDIMISADHFSLLCKKLNIGAEIYTPESIELAKQDPDLGLITHGAQNLPDREYAWTMKVYNQGQHWEYQEPEGKLKKMQRHNYFYPASFAENDPKLGKFKTYSTLNDNQIKLISDHVKTACSNKPTDNALGMPNTPSTPIPPLATKLKDMNENNKKNCQTKYDKLHLTVEKVMDGLLNKLDNAFDKKSIDNTQRQMIFEFYFNSFEEEFKQADSGSTELNDKKIKAIIKEIQNGDLTTYRTNAIQDGLTTFDKKIKFNQI